MACTLKKIACHRWKEKSIKMVRISMILKNGSCNPDTYSQESFRNSPFIEERSYIKTRWFKRDELTMSASSHITLDLPSITVAMPDSCSANCCLVCSVKVIYSVQNIYLIMNNCLSQLYDIPHFNANELLYTSVFHILLMWLSFE